MISMRSALGEAQNRINRFIRQNSSKYTNEQEKVIFANLSKIVKSIDAILAANTTQVPQDTNHNEFYSSKFQSEVINKLTEQLPQLVVTIYRAVIIKNGTKVLDLHKPLNDLIEDLEKLKTNTHKKIDEQKRKEEEATAQREAEKEKEEERKEKEAQKRKQEAAEQERLRQEKAVREQQEQLDQMAEDIKGLQGIKEELGEVKEKVTGLEEEAERLRQSNLQLTEYNEELAAEAKEKERLRKEAETRAEEAEATVEATKNTLTEMFAQLATLDPNAADTFIKAIEGPTQTTPGGSRKRQRGRDGDKTKDIFGPILREFKARKLEEARIDYPKGYEMPEGFVRGQTVGEWKTKAGSDYRTYDLAKLHIILSTRRYLAVAHLLTYLDSFKSDLAMNGSSTSDAPEFKHLAMAFIFHTLVQPNKTWDELKGKFATIFTYASTINNKCSVLATTLATINRLTAADHDAPNTTTIKEIALTVKSLFVPVKINRGSSGLLVRFEGDHQQKYITMLSTLAAGGSLNAEDYFPNFVAAANKDTPVKLHEKRK